MNTITIPFWIFALSIGVPCMSILCLLGLLIRRIRAPKKDMFDHINLHHTQDRKSAGAQFHSELFITQIDTIFKGLNAIVETERLKIKALLNPDNNFLMEMPRPAVKAEQMMNPKSPAEAPEPAQKTETTLEQQIVKFAESGEQLEDIANELGLSQTEIDLAMRMRSSKQSGQGQKLEAVA